MHCIILAKNICSVWKKKNEKKIPSQTPSITSCGNDILGGSHRPEFTFWLRNMKWKWPTEVRIIAGPSGRGNLQIEDIRAAAQDLLASVGGARPTYGQGTASALRLATAEYTFRTIIPIKIS